MNATKTDVLLSMMDKEQLQAILDESDQLLQEIRATNAEIVSTIEELQRIQRTCVALLMHWKEDHA